MLRTKVEFSSSLPDDSIEDGHNFVVLPGKNVAEALRELLAGLGCDVEPVEGAGDHGWDFRFRRGEGRFYCELTIIDGVVAQFDNVGARASSAPRQAEFAELLAEFNAALEADARFHQIGWFTADEVTSQQAGAISPTGAYSQEPCHRSIGPRPEQDEGSTGFERRPDARPPARDAGDVSADHLAGGSAPWTDRSPHPVRRFVARQFDSYVTTGVLLLALALPWILFSSSDTPALALVVLAGVYLASPVRGLAAAALNAGMLHWTSTTPGKWLCGVMIVGKEGGRLTFRAALKRELEVLIAGCGMNILVISGLAAIWNFIQLRQEGGTSWDRRRDLVAVQRPNGVQQTVLTVLAFLPVTLILGAIAVMFNALQASHGAAAP